MSSLIKLEITPNAAEQNIGLSSVQQGRRLTYLFSYRQSDMTFDAKRILLSRKQPIETHFWNKCSEGGTFLTIAYLSVQWYLKEASWKICICSITNKIVLIWKIGSCSVAKKVVLENQYLFDEQIYLSGKFLFVRWTLKLPGKDWKKVLLEEKNRYFRKLSRWLLLFFLSNIYQIN